MQKLKYSLNQALVCCTREIIDVNAKITRNNPKGLRNLDAFYCNRLKRSICMSRHIVFIFL